MPLNRCILLLAGLVLVCSSAFGQAVALPAWQLNAWGGRATAVEFAVDPRCGAGGYFFSKTKQGDGDAELVLPDTLAPGRAYRFSVQVRSVVGQGAVDIYFRRTSAFYEMTAIRPLRPTRDVQTVVLTGIHDSPGRGGVRVAIRNEGLGICLMSPTLEAISVDMVGDGAIKRTVTPQFFGIHLNRLGAHNGWPSFNPGVVRMWDTGTTWADLQPERGKIDWAGNPHGQRFDYFARHVKRANPNSLMLVTLGMTPNWASSQGDGSCGSADYGKKACFPPAELEDWRLYVRALATRFRGRVKYWEVLNEADVPIHWNGSAAKLVDLARVAHEELKSVDPSNVVLSPSVTMLGFSLLNDFLRLGGGQYIDAVAVHAYIGRTPSLGVTKLRNLQELIKGHGLNLPIWNTEAGLSCIPEVDCDSYLAGRPPMDGVAALAQAYLGQAAQGVVSISYHTWEGGVTQAGGLPFVRNDHQTPTVAGEVMARLRQWMVGADISWLPTTAGKIRRVALNTSDKRCVVSWAESGEGRVSAELMGGALELVDVMGSAQLRQGDGFKVTTLPVMGCVELGRRKQ